MAQTKHVVIAGAGGIASAAGLILAAWSRHPVHISILNRNASRTEEVAQWIRSGAGRSCQVRGLALDPDNDPETLRSLQEADILLDCLPGFLAPYMARLALQHNMHYVNLTEYVRETEEIQSLAKNAKKAFLLQAGLAPGYINVLARMLFQKFCDRYGTQKADSVEMKVGALPHHAVPPHYYGFTWSPIGVATEYLEPASVIRDFKKQKQSALSEREELLIDGVRYEADLTSGGAADLPEHFEGIVKNLDYKTLRFPGHYAWVEKQQALLSPKEDRIQALEKRMLRAVPHLEDDQIVIYAAIQGYGSDGNLHRVEHASRIRPLQVGSHQLRAIQATTAAAMLQAAELLLDNSMSGVILQSQIDPAPFLAGEFVTPVYGRVFV